MAEFYDYYGHLIKLDAETGMPEVPEGYFWRVKKDLLRTVPKKPYEVHLRRVGRMFSHKVCYILSEPTKEDVLHSAAHIMHHKFIPMQKVDDDLLGDYPPKKLDE